MGWQPRDWKFHSHYRETFYIESKGKKLFSDFTELEIKDRDSWDRTAEKDARQLNDFESRYVIGNECPGAL